MSILRLLRILIGAELVVCGVLFGLRWNATLPAPPAVAEYTDAITGAEILALPDRFLFDSAVKWRTLGQMYMQSKFFAKAEACWRAARDRDPTSANDALWHGCCLEQLGKLEEARQAYVRAAQAGSARIAEPAWYRIGRIHLQLEQAAEAASAFEKAGDNHLPSVYQRAKLLVRAGSAGQAEPLLDRLTEDHPRDIRVLLLKARWAEALGRTGEAAVARDTALRSTSTLEVEELRKTMLPQGEPFGMYDKIARIMQQRQTHDASQIAEQLLPFVRDETLWQNKVPLLLEDVAELQFEARNFASARDLLERQIEQRGPKTNRAWELLARVELAENHLPQAWRLWNRAELLRPNGVDHARMALLAEKLGDGAAARRHRGLAQQCAGISSFLNDGVEAAREAFRQAVTIDADLPHAWYYLGETERLLGAQLAAKAAFARCLELMPNHGRAHDRLRRLERDGSS